jgi:hypothetical protein
MMVLHYGELEHAVSKATSSPLPRHRIGILLFPDGRRFLECADCQIRFTFPDGTQFGTIAKKFEFHLCPPIDIPASRTERRFVIVRHEGKVPAMASCAKCQLKFFTPATFACDPVRAELYLLDKFHLHDCGKEPTE